MNIPLLDLKKQYQSISDDINHAVLNTMRAGRFIMGEEVESLEKELADYLGVRHAITCGNGTDALMLTLKAFGIGPGDEVITTPFTFFATAEAISCVGAKPVFVDVENDTFNIDPTQIKHAITPKTKAIIPVHVFGNPADMGQIREIAEKNSIVVIEDACQAIGGVYKKQKVGSLGDAACFSFFPTKNLGAYGDGGLITTNDEKIAIILTAMRMHGSGLAGEEAYNALHGLSTDMTLDVADETIYNPKKYYNYLIGHNSRLDAIQAAILRVKLKYLDLWNKKRNEKAAYYTDNLREINISPQYIPEENFSAYHLYVIQADDRNTVVDKLNKNHIATGIYYPIPLHLQTVYNDLGYSRGDLPNAEYLSERTFAIPLYPEITVYEQDYVIDVLKKVVN
ncbi:MAG TPA: DegT/DnrJ/EryC1/StrS family aminotransferase [Saprospiraceae bacterium]|nr:DegT/DnrJ/EryC1/StrS family aminotransferase [Saprospiraceae bacterium]